MGVSLTFFISVQVWFYVIAVILSACNTIILRKTLWASVCLIYTMALGALTLRRIIVLLQGRPTATAQDVMIWQSFIALGFLNCSAWAFGLLLRRIKTSWEKQ